MGARGRSGFFGNKSADHPHSILAERSGRLFQRLLLPDGDQIRRWRLRYEDAAVWYGNPQHEYPIARALPESFALIDTVDKDPSYDHHHRHQRRQGNDESQPAKELSNHKHRNDRQHWWHVDFLGHYQRRHQVSFDQVND